MYLREDILGLGNTFAFFADVAGDKHTPVTALKRGSLALLVFPTSLFRWSIPDTGGEEPFRPTFFPLEDWLDLSGIMCTPLWIQY